METGAEIALVVIGMVAFANYRNGTLGDWLKAKFLNQAAPAAEPAAFSGGSSSSGGGGGGTHTLVGTGSSDPSTWLGRLITPVVGQVTSSFGDSRPGHLHEGIDLAAASGTPIDSAAAGTVTYAGASGDYGLRVDVDHGGGLVTRYGHLSSIGVGVGQQLAAGQQLGQVGATGDATGPHLHFEVRDNGVAVDPAPYLGPLTPSSQVVTS